MSKKTKAQKTPQAKAALSGGVEAVFALYDSGAYAKCVQLTALLREQPAAVRDETTAQALVIGGWSAYRQGRMNEAQTIVESLRAAKTAFRSLDRLEIVTAASFAQSVHCLQLWRKYAAGEEWQRELSSAFGQMLYECRDAVVAVGEAAAKQADYDLARSILAQAGECRTDIAEFYIAQSEVCRRRGDTAGQRRAISAGLVQAVEKRDLAKLGRDLAGPERVSLCMIVKNEEKFLPQCLNSVKDFVDEMIIVDTGSTDRTMEIAESFGAKVYHHQWQNDFSLHRNQSLGYATGEWIFILDADEEMVREDLEKLRLALCIPDTNILSISVHNKHTRTGEFTSFLPSVRLWRRKLNLRYEGIVHNELRLPADEPILRVDARLIHYGYGLDWAEMTKKIARSKELLQAQLKENPNNAFANFNLAQLLRGEHQSPPEDVCRQILDYAGRAVANTRADDPNQRHIHLMALDQMTSAYFFLKDFDRAEKCAQRALRHDPNYIDPLFALGHVYAAQRDFPKAIAAYQRYLAAADAYDPGKETTNYILIHAADQVTALFSLGLIYEDQERLDLAEQYFRQVVERRPDHLDVQTHLAMVCFHKGDYAEARQMAERRLAAEPNDVTARYISARIAHDGGEVQNALSQVDEILSREPGHQRALELRITALRELGRDGEAQSAIAALLAVDPRSYSAYNQLAELHAARGQHERAAEAYLRLSEYSPDDAEVFNNLANCYFRLQDFATAIRYYSIALSIQPQLAPALRNIGLAYFKSNDAAAAVRHLASYLDHAPDDVEITYLAARLYFDLTQYNDAIRYIERALTKYPRSAELVAFLADNYLKQGHLESAELGYRKALEYDRNFQPAQRMLEELARFRQETQQAR